MKKTLGLLIRLSLVVCFSLLFSFLTYASQDTKDEYIEYFNIEESVLYEKVVNNQDSIEVINDYDFFEFVQGFSRYNMSTFNSQRYLVGEGDPGVEIGIIIYTVNKNNVIEIQGKPTVDVIGASGLYNKTITYDHIGENHVIISVKKGKEVVYKHFVVNRKAEETKNKLEILNIQLISPK
jgi:hypothetical protein